MLQTIKMLQNQNWKQSLSLFICMYVCMTWSAFDCLSFSRYIVSCQMNCLVVVLLFLFPCRVSDFILNLYFLYIFIFSLHQYLCLTGQGDNIPPPFMTFDATGFPPEILREVSLLFSCYVELYALVLPRKEIVLLLFPIF